MFFFLAFWYMFFATQTLPWGLVASLTVSNTLQLGVIRKYKNGKSTLNILSGLPTSHKARVYF